MASHAVFGQAIFIDEKLDDWQQIVPLYEDSDDSFSPVNFGTLKMMNDDRFLYFYLEVGTEINLQDANNVTIYLDTDNKDNTGNTVDEIGADLEYNLGQRRGSVHRSSSTTINSYNIGLASSPTVTSTWFEFKIDLNSTINGTPLFSGNKVGIVIKSASGDQIPENNEILRYELNTTQGFQSVPYQIIRPNNTDLRILSYNVRRDDLFNPANQPHFERLIQAINPDIIGFQEIYNNSGEQTAQLMEQFLPSGEGEQWYAGDTGNDNLIISRYPVLQQASVDGNAAYLLDLGDKELMALVAHPPCCSNGDAGRQRELNALMAFVRNSKTGTRFDIAENTPIVIMGDMNLVGLAQQQRTLLTGDITNEATHGPDFSPDWDGTDFDDAKPGNPGLPTTFTWYSSSSSFSAGRLDYMVYSGSVLDLINTFSLFTPSLPADTLAHYGLEQNDSISASDHLPVVADFIFKAFTSTEGAHQSPSQIQLQQNYPNPFNPGTNIAFSLDKPARISLTIHTLSGRTIATVFDDKTFAAGQFSHYFDATSFASGVYIYRLQAGDEIITKKMVLIK